MATARRATLCFLLAFAAPSPARTPDDMERPFDQYSWVTTHNAFTSNGLVPNQTQTIATQLASGVRALMLDLHYSEGRVRLCHKRCTGHGSATFADLLNDTLLPFLDENPDIILSIHLEDTTTPAQLSTELAKAPGLAGRTFDPYTWDTRGWPTYRQLRDSGQRVLIFSLNEDNTGTFPVAEAAAVHIMASSEYTVENYWSLGTTILQHDNSCVSRWDQDRPLDRRTIAGKPGWRPLFTMNQFHGIAVLPHADTDNSFENLSSRYLQNCRPATKRKPNFVAVDFHQRGDTAKFADWLTLSAPDEL